MSFSVFDEKVAQNWIAAISNGSGTNLLALWSIDAQTRRVDAITIVSTDTVDRAVQLYAQVNSVDVPIIEVPVPALAGHGAVKPVEVLAALDQVNLPAFIVAGGSNLRVSAVATITATKNIYVIGWGGIF